MYSTFTVALAFRLLFEDSIPDYKLISYLTTYSISELNPLFIDRELRVHLLELCIHLPNPGTGSPN